MTKNRYDIKWVGRCTYEGSDKVWGWFVYNDPTANEITNRRPEKAYTFWAATGKTPSFKKHPFGEWEMNKLVHKKKDRKYEEISSQNLLSLWPTMYDDFDYKFIFNLLADNI